MSEIKEILNANDSVLAFDIDGVLALMEYDKYNHFMSDEKWHKEFSNGRELYTSDLVIKKMQKFLENKDMSRIYIVSLVDTPLEITQKQKYCNKYYNIPIENMYFVDENNDKVNKLKEIKQKYKDLEDYKIVMIDDTVEILNNIMNNSNFSTVHISSFLDI